ncbi:MAG: type IV secretory system conjugative DNA transfer family protein, partial [Patescibacteria group bacterium]
VLAAADNDSDAGDILLSLAGSFSQFSAPRRNGFRLVAPRKISRLVYQYIFREFDHKQSMVLNTEEIASVFHFPTVSTNIPRINWLKSRESAPPQNLPDTGIIIGESIFRGDNKKVRLSDNDRRRHFYTVGQTGTGKSYFMLNTIVQDMEAGKGLCVIDPHGELIEKVLERVPASRLEDVIVFNPGDVGRPLGLNMLEYNFDRPEEKTFIVNEIQSIFNRLFDKETMGPMFEQYMRNALLLLMEDAKYEATTLMEVPRIFTDPEFRHKKLARISNPTVIDFWEKEAAKTTGEHGLANMTPYITSKFGNFIANDYMRPIIGQPKSAFNFRTVMDEGKILLVNLAKGKIGDINAGLLGMICTGRLLLAALSRGDINENERQDFYLYIDEFQNFTTDSISVILSEARKYRLNLILAHQFIAQLTDEIRESVFGNVGSMASFRVGTTDAEHLVKHFGPVFSENDLISIENQHAFAKLLINGEPAKPFNIKVPKVEGGSKELADQLKELSRLTYGRDLGQVEQEILFRLRQ